MQSVIVSTYEKPRHLRLCLEGLRRQTHRDFEVIVADDGSGPETAEVVREFARRVDFRVEHVWQADEGFRAARIRNLGVKAARGDQVVFLDGDCVPFPGFLEAHAEGARDPRRVSAGDRMFLGEQESATLGPDDVPNIPRLLGPSEPRKLQGRALKNLIYRATGLKKDRPKVVTANLSLTRTAFEDINGLDERFIGWGHEDEDLRRRLVASGYVVRSVFTRAHVCHIWHQPVASFHGRVRNCDNFDYYHRGFYLSRCRQGLETRAMDDCRIVWNGVGPTNGHGPCEIAISWGADSIWPEAEIRVWVARAGNEGLDPSGKAHVIIICGGDANARAQNGSAPLTISIEEAADPADERSHPRILAALEPIV